MAEFFDKNGKVYSLEQMMDRHNCTGTWIYKRFERANYVKLEKGTKFCTLCKETDLKMFQPHRARRCKSCDKDRRKELRDNKISLNPDWYKQEGEEMEQLAKDRVALKDWRIVQDNFTQAGWYYLGG